MKLQKINLVFWSGAALDRVCQCELSSVCVLLLGDDFGTKASANTNKLVTLFAVDPALHFDLTRLARDM